MDGEVHYRRTGGRLSVRSAGDRRLHARVLRWAQPIKLSNGALEWFGKDSALELDPPVPLQVQRGGPATGRTLEWRSTPLGLDAVLVADESPTGDGLLDLLDRWGHGADLPCGSARRACTAGAGDGAGCT